jgi:hypothetical protein
LRYRRNFGDPSNCFRYESGLSHPGRGDDGDEIACLRTPCVLECIHQRLELAAPANERRLETTGAPRHAAYDFPELERGDGPLGASKNHFARRLDAHRVLYEAVSRGPHKDAARGRYLFELGGKVDGVARHDRLQRAPIAGDDFPGVHSRADREPNAKNRFDLVVQAFDRVVDLRRRAHRPERVVFVHDGYSEYRHDRVPGEFLNRAAVTRYDSVDCLEVAPD